MAKQQNQEYDYLFKILIVGESGVGKSCLLLKFVDNTFAERYRTIVSSFYRGTHGIMLVFDLTDINSFLKVRHWLSEIKRMTPENTPLLLVGNKADMTGKRMVELKEASGFAEKSGLKYFETSAKTGQHVEEAFMTLGKQCLEQAIKDGVGPTPEPEHLPPENPKGWCSC